MTYTQEREYKVGGPVSSSGNYFYIEREADNVLSNLCQKREFSYILASRQIGKTTLIFQVAKQLKELNVYNVAVLDLNSVGKDTTPPQEWFFSFIEKIGKQLKLDIDFSNWWKEKSHISYVSILESFFDRVLDELPGSTVVFIDEIDSILGSAFSNDFFAAIRAFYNARLQDPRFNRLVFVFVGVATPDELINDVQRTPFNIAHRIDLHDFDHSQVKELVRGLGLSKYKTNQLAKAIYYWTNGHPFLTQRICAALVDKKIPLLLINRFARDSVAVEFFQAWQEDTHFSSIAQDVTQRSPEAQRKKILQTYRRIRRNWILDKVPYSRQSKIHAYLKLSGIVKEASGFLTVRNNIYKKNFDLQWIDSYLSFFEKIKSASFAARIATIAILVGIILLIVSFRERRLSNTANTLLAQAHSEATALAKYGETNMATQEASSLATRTTEKIVAEAKLATREAIAVATITSKEQELHTISTRSANAIATSIAAESTAVFSATRSADAGNLLQRANLDIEAISVSNQTERLYQEKGDPSLALLLGVQSVKLHDSISQIAKVVLEENLSKLIRKIDYFGNVISEHQLGIKTIEFSPDGNLLATSDEDGNIFVWNYQDLTYHTAHYTNAENVITTVAFSSDGKMLAEVGNIQSEIRSEELFLDLWDVSTNEKIQSIQLDYGSYSVDFSPNDNYLAIASNDKTVRLWIRGSDDHYVPLTTLEGHNDTVLSVTFSPDGNLLASSDQEGQIILWDLTDMSSISSRHLKGRSRPRNHTSAVWDIEFSPAIYEEKLYLASASIDNWVVVWDISSGQPDTDEHILVSNNPVLTNNKGLFYSVAFAYEDDSLLLAAGAEDGTIRVWDVLANEFSYDETFRVGHHDAIRALAFHPLDSSLIASGGFVRDSAVRLWNLERNPYHNFELDSMPAFEDLLEFACSKVRRNLTEEEWDLYVSDKFNYQQTCPSVSQ